MEMPHTEYLKSYCPIAKEGGCIFYNDFIHRGFETFTIAIGGVIAPCILDETLNEGCIILQENFTFDKNTQFTSRVEEIHLWLQNKIDTYILNNFGMVNNHLKVIGITITPTSALINIKMVCPRFRVISIKNRFFNHYNLFIVWFRKYLKGEDLPFKNEIIQHFGGIISLEEFLPFRQTYLNLIAQKFPTWRFLT